MIKKLLKMLLKLSRPNPQVIQIIQSNPLFLL